MKVIKKKEEIRVCTFEQTKRNGITITEKQNRKVQTKRTKKI
jgi:hypothetical protein